MMDAWRNSHVMLDLARYGVTFLRKSRILRTTMVRTAKRRLSPLCGYSLQQYIVNHLDIFQHRQGPPADGELSEEVEEMLVAAGAPPHRHPE
jgi:hypothetical protein